ncbi:MAG: DUF1565 domain-containing protein [Planctomycetes bacterium]|nr:DUF1565 domain-containing protein [Planctomycetota bacterium]
MPGLMRAALAAAGLLLLSGSAAVQTLYVDPAGGQDAPGHGSAALPLKTIAYAVTRYAGKPVTLELRLQPGSYDTTSGEVFPIALPARATLRAVVPGTVEIRKSAMQFTTVFSAVDAERLQLEGVLVGSPDRGLQCTNNPGTGLVLDLIGVRMANSRDLAVNLQAARADVTLTGCELRGGDSGVILSAQQGSVANLSLERCVVANVWHGVNANASGAGSTIFSLIRGCLFDAPGVNGVLSQTSLGAQSASWIEGCVFHRCGTATIPPSGQALHDVWDSQSAAPLHSVVNSTFFQNGRDMPEYSAATYLLQHNLVQDPGLVGVGGSLSGDPLFVDAPRGNFRLTLGSPGRDRGANTHVTQAVDFDGAPRIDPPQLGGAGVVDIGAYEYYPCHVSACPVPVKPGVVVRYRLVGPPGALALLGLGSGIDPHAPFGDRLRLLGLSPPIWLGVVGLDHSLTWSFGVPSAPSLVGLTCHWQAGFVHASGVTFSYNVLAQTVVRA